MDRDGVLAAHAAFYQALRRGDLDALSSLWAQGEDVCCIHPGGFALFGHDAVLQSWARILAQGAIDVVEENPIVHWLDRHAMVVCTERIGRHVLAATNSLRLVDGRFLLTHHHASPTPIEASDGSTEGALPH